MFLGHFGAAYAARRAAPRVSLGWLFAASQLPDLIWPVLLLLGIERARIDPGNTAFTPIAFDHYPWSHSLLMVALTGGVVGAIYAALRRDRRGGVTIGALVVSHWFLDALMHRSDLPLYPGGATAVGLGLWNAVTLTLAIEGVALAAGVWLYTRTTAARDRIGSYGSWGLVAFLVVIQIASAFGPPPPGITPVAIAGLSIWLLVLWAWWTDSHREVVARSGMMEA